MNARRAKRAFYARFRAFVGWGCVCINDPRWPNCALTGMRGRLPGRLRTNIEPLDTE
jgi:hypothetical protein